MEMLIENVVLLLIIWVIAPPKISTWPQIKVTKPPLEIPLQFPGVAKMCLGSHETVTKHHLEM